MPSTTASGTTIEYEVAGHGEPILLVMGLNEQLTSWPDDFVDELVALGFKVIRFDNREVGLSSESSFDPPSQFRRLLDFLLRRRPSAPYDIHDMATDAVAVLDALELGSAHVVGVSMGGMIAQALAIDHPTRVRTLVSIMSNPGDQRTGRPSVRLGFRLLRLDRPTRETAEDSAVEAFRLVSGPEFDEAEVRRIARRNADRSWRPLAVERQLTAIAASPDRTEALGSVTAPTLVVHGLLDELVQPSGGIATANAISGSRLLMFPDMAHDLPRSRRTELTEAIARNARRVPQLSLV